MSSYTIDQFSITIAGGKITDVRGETIEHDVNLLDIELTRDQVLEMAVKGFQQGPRKNDLFSDNDPEEPSTNVLIALRGDGKMELISNYDELIWNLHNLSYRGATYYQVAIEDDLF